MDNMMSLFEVSQRGILIKKEKGLKNLNKVPHRLISINSGILLKNRCLFQSIPKQNYQH